MSTSSTKTAPSYVFALWCLVTLLILLGAHFFSRGLILLCAPASLFAGRIHARKWDRTDTNIVLTGLMILSILTLAIISSDQLFPRPRPLLFIQTEKARRTQERARINHQKPSP